MPDAQCSLLIVTVQLMGSESLDYHSIRANPGFIGKVQEFTGTKPRIPWGISYVAKAWFP